MYSIYVDIFHISLLETMDLKTKLLISLELRLSNKQRTSDIAIAA